MTNKPADNFDNCQSEIIIVKFKRQYFRKRKKYWYHFEEIIEGSEINNIMILSLLKFNEKEDYTFYLRFIKISTNGQFQQMLPGRPIVFHWECEYYMVSEYIDSFLSPLATNHPSYVKDTHDFLQKLNKSNFLRIVSLWP